MSRRFRDGWELVAAIMEPFHVDDERRGYGSLVHELVPSLVAAALWVETR